ncbi:MAG: mechanosensitive ion channel [Micromonosporaceae bacterium]|nr:mechanosensitive ion channel [Micromonosporaceae bacterium]
MPDVLIDVLSVVAAVLGTVLVVTAVHRILRRAGRKSQLVQDLTGRAYWPVAVMTALLAARVAIPAFTTNGWHVIATRVITILTIGAGGWLAAALLHVVADAALQRFRVDVQDNLTARRLHTQITVLRRVGLAAVIVVTTGTILTTFPQARAVGTSVLASAGLAGIVAGLAVQSMMRNFFAGMQLAFGNALRLDDVVVVEDEWGRVEEMTLGYVVIRIWDERRLILPSSYFTEKPFQNWTRTGASVLGTVEVDVDWAVPIEEMRQAVCEIAEEQRATLWDGRVSSLQVTAATDGTIRARALVSAADSSKLWDLRCLLRERLVEWVQQRHPDARPRIRTELSHRTRDVELETAPGGQGARRKGGQGSDPPLPPRT